MEEAERDRLIIETHCEVKSIKEWTQDHRVLHKDEKTARTRWTLFCLGTLAAFGTKLLFWK